MFEALYDTPGKIPHGFQALCARQKQSQMSLGVLVLCPAQPERGGQSSSTARARAGDDKPRSGRVAELFVYDNFSRVPVEQAEAGDICALTGLADVSIGETI